MTLALLNLAYEVLLYQIPIPQSLYRIIALRYTMHLACGVWISDALKGKNNLSKTQIAVMFSAFIVGCLYISFAVQNANETLVFKYGTWGITNIFSCFYIVPLFYLAIKILLNRKIRWKPVHKALIMTGRNTYYILCTQMIMFWVVDAVWTRIGAPLALQMMGNVCMGCVSGVFLGIIIAHVNTAKL